MKHSQEKAAGVSHPPAAQMESQSLGDVATLADPHSMGFDNLHGIPQAAQAGAACGQYGSGGTVPNVAPAAPVSPAVGKQHKRKDPFAGMFGGEGQPAEQTWGKPLPLRTSIKALPYPIEVLPPLIRNAIKEVEEFTQAPTAMIAASALAAVSTTVQGLVSVERGEGLRGPASLYFLTLAVSGERKTSADKYFTKAISEWESEQAEAAKPALAEHRARATEWQCTEEGYKQAIKKNAASGAMLDRHHADLLKQLELNKPIEPRVPAVLRMDDTPESLGVALTRWPVAAVMSNEAGIIFGAHGMNPESVMRNMAGLNVCWDGGHLKRDRTSTQSINVEGMRVTVGLQVQPDTLQAFLNKQGALARGIGFLARFLVAHPESTQGTRFYREQKQGAPALTAFNARAKQLLGCPAQVDVEGRLSTTYLTLSPEAKETWVRFHDEVEEELGRGRDYYDVQDVASKAADNAARLAACLHTFSDHTGITVIGADSMEAGAELMRWYLFESLRFCRQVAIPEGLRKAEMLEEWLIEMLRDGMPLVPTRVVSQMGPNPIRKAADRDAAIDILEAHNRAKVFEYGQKKEISLNPEVVNEYRR
jgi:putative DNA primase/helicase